jgi:5'-methylthioadenosine phosphorylase
MIGIIGGSGLYDMAGLEILGERNIDTPFGATSDAVRLGRIDGIDVAFLPRHGRGHRMSPSEVPYRANIWALKSVGVEAILSVSAVGSLREDIAPGQLVFADQFIDRTRGQRPHTFFEGGCVAHVSFADPTCTTTIGLLIESAKAEGIVHHTSGTYVCIEGPQFSTRAESRLYRSWGADIIGMTNLTEAKLAREAEIHYATIAMATDYDVWHESEEDVTVEAVMATMRQNVAAAQRLIRRTVPVLAKRLGSPVACGCGRALEFAVMTAPDHVSDSAKSRLEILLERSKNNAPAH